MNYPLISEYIEAIKSAEDNFNQLKNLRPVLDEAGIPIMTSGNFAVVFKMEDPATGKRYAVKCFIKDQEGRSKAYRLISEELKDVESDYLTSFQYLEKELFVDTGQDSETEYPVLVMDWVEGVTLDRFIQDNLEDKYILGILAYRFSLLAEWLLSQPFAHGDLKPENIIVQPGCWLTLVDYDGMFVPAMLGQKAREIGSPDFRHPARTENTFNEHIDGFPLISILVSLKAIGNCPDLIKRYGSKDRLLLSSNDYRDINKSAIINKTYPSQDEDYNRLVALLHLSLAQKSLQGISPDLLVLQEPNYLEAPSVWTDGFGVTYSADGLQLFEGSRDIVTYYCRKGIKSIRRNAFSGLGPGTLFSIESIIIPNTVTLIEEDAFRACIRLSSIDFPDSVISIGDNAFSDCHNLTSVKIPYSVASIGKNAFSFCPALSSIVIDPDNPYYDSRDNCNAIIDKDSNTLLFGCAKTIIPDSVIKIGSAFCGCDSLYSISIPNSVTSIGIRAFYLCARLTSIIIPESVTIIGEGAFIGCANLASIVIPKSVTHIEKFTFSGCAKLASVVLPNTVRGIGERAFYGCTSLISIVIPKSVRSIGECAFDNCPNLRYMVFPKGREKLIKKIKEDLPNTIFIEDDTTGIS